MAGHLSFQGVHDFTMLDGTGMGAPQGSRRKLVTERSYIGNARLIDGSGQAVPPEPYALLVEGR